MGWTVRARPRVPHQIPQRLIVALVGDDALDNSHEYLEVAEDCGLPADEHQELAAELRSLGVPVDEIIPSIRSIEEVG